VNREKLPPREWRELHVGDIVKFGVSERIYAVNGPDDLRPPEVRLAFLR
jgi:hypothetical protein